MDDTQHPARQVHLIQLPISPRNPLGDDRICDRLLLHEFQACLLKKVQPLRPLYAVEVLHLVLEDVRPGGLRESEVFLDGRTRIII